MSLYLFQFKDSIASNYRNSLPKYFHISKNTTYDVILLRLLTSTVEIIDTRNNKTIKLETNYTTFPAFRVSRKSGKQIKSIITPFKYTDYTKFSNKFYGRNIIFYYNLLQELTFYFVYSDNKQNQSAFVNLYRALEYISYSIPLIHASHFSNFLGTFEAFRSYFKDEKTSELKFFEMFVSKLLEGTPYLSLTTVFDFSCYDKTISSNCYDAFYSLLKPTDWTSANASRFILEVENKNLLKLFKNTRNKYFHFAIGGQRNLQITDLKDPDVFFQKVNGQFLNWIGFIFSNVIRENLDNTLL